MDLPLKMIFWPLMGTPVLFSTSFIRSIRVLESVISALCLSVPTKMKKHKPISKCINWDLFWQ